MSTTEVELYADKEYLTQFVSFIENYYIANSVTPSLEMLGQRFDLPSDTVKEVLKLSQVKKVLEAKYLYDNYFRTEKGFTALQIDTLNILTNQYDKRSLKEKLKVVKVTPARFKRWLEDPNFAKVLNTRVNQSFKNDSWRIKQAIVETAVGGDVQAQKFALELMGEYQPSTRVTGNISIDNGRTVDLLVECIIKHVKDINVVNAIAADFQAVMEGGTMQTAGRAIAEKSVVQVGTDSFLEI